MHLFKKQQAASALAKIDDGEVERRVGPDVPDTS